MYLKQSRERFYKQWLRGKRRKCYGQWLDMRGDACTFSQAADIIRQMVQVQVNGKNVPARGTLKFGFWPGKWIGYRFEAPATV